MEFFLRILFIWTDVKTTEEDKTIEQNDFVLHKHSPEPCPLAVCTYCFAVKGHRSPHAIKIYKHKTH